ncbi:MAG: DUF1684 domain-containing protein [Thermoplasmata archaeon]|nr:DUF1684 domain-containing protein [Thermoplasmata archaeon]MCI4358880.1 DUF1684 domain-containing protein [Thermoplasmata archaeon]
MDQYTQDLKTEREMKDRFMAHHTESPFVADGVAGFEGLHYFPISTRYLVRAQLKRASVPSEAFLRTNRDGQAVVRYLGELHFAISGRKLHLRVFHAGEGVGRNVFVPFRDSTSGRETYGPGRYLTLELNEDDVYEVDFNRAFNPYCAYTDAYECSFPPAENDLPVAVEAGERVWSVDRNPRSPSSAVMALLPPRPGPKASPSSKAKPRPSRAAAPRRKPSSKGRRPTKR